MKYIVYCTTNLVNNKIYIGVHGTVDPDIFDGYLGNSLSTKDKYLMNHPKEPFHYAVKKYGIKNFQRKTIAVFDTVEEALQLEKQIVNEDFIKRKDTYNITVGGGMPPIYKKTIYQYSLDGIFIKEWSSIREAALELKCSDSSIGRAVLDGTPSMKYFWTDYKKDTLDIDNFKIDGNKSVTYLYTYSGQFLQEFKSISECARYLSLTPSRVEHCIKDQTGINKKWRVSDKKYDILPIIKRQSHRNCPLYQYDLEGNFIRKWENLSEVRNFYKRELNIANSIKQGHSCNGFQWSWEKVPFMKKLQNKSGRVRSVGKYDLDGNLIKVYKSVNEAKRENGSCVVNMLRGKQKTAKGYIYKYIEQ